MAQRIGARGIDAAVWFGAAAIVAGVDAALRAITGVEAPASDSTDAIGTVTALALILVTIAYDPLTTRIWGATIGKRAVGVRVVSADDSSPASLGAVAGRHVLQLILWSACLVPGILDLIAGARDRHRRTWHDRALSTIVVCNPARRSRPRPPTLVAARSLPVPWSTLVAEGEAARQRLEHSMAVTGSGPVHDRLVDARTRVAECVARCGEVAARGAQLHAVASAVDLEAVRSRYRSAQADRDQHPHDPDAAKLAAALEGELASAERLHELVAQTERTLRRLVSQLNDAVNRAAEVAFAPDGAG
ncbi:MAG: RDD family protein, partial [Actinomycetota bacterium]